MNSWYFTNKTSISAHDLSIMVLYWYVLTKNQIEYQKLLEERARNVELRRSNTANEELTRRRDLGTLELRGKELAETQRSNYAREFETNRSNIAKEIENVRSNKAREQETHRSNVANEEETKRANVERERETSRHNIASEGNERLKAEAAMGRAAAQFAQVGLGYANLNELNRSNLAREQETVRANKAKETETTRSHLIGEMIDMNRQRTNDRLATSQIENDKINRTYTVAKSNLESERQGFTNANQALDSAWTASRIINMFGGLH